MTEAVSKQMRYLGRIGDLAGLGTLASDTYKNYFNAVVVPNLVKLLEELLITLNKKGITDYIYLYKSTRKYEMAGPHIEIDSRDHYIRNGILFWQKVGRYEGSPDLPRLFVKDEIEHYGFAHELLEKIRAIEKTYKLKLTGTDIKLTPELQKVYNKINRRRKRISSLFDELSQVKAKKMGDVTEEEVKEIRELTKKAKSLGIEFHRY